MPKRNLLINKSLVIIAANKCRLISQCSKFVGNYNTQKKNPLCFPGYETRKITKKDSRLRFERNLLFFL